MRKFTIKMRGVEERIYMADRGEEKDGQVVLYVATEIAGRFASKDIEYWGEMA